MKRLIIAGDFFPSDKNVSLFENGKIHDLFDDRIIGLFSQSDFSIINLEGALTTCNKPQKKIGPIIKASPDAVKVFQELGVSAAALANNHVTDYLCQGVADTIGTLDKAGIQHVGASSDGETINRSLSIQFEDKKVCIYNVSETFFNMPYVNVYDEYAVCNEIKELKSNHDYVIVIYHGGPERCQYPSPNLRKRFHRMADCGADFITAQHTHCIGCEEEYNGSKLLYGQGNFFFTRMNQPNARKGLLIELLFENGKVLVKYHLVVVSHEGKLQYDSQQDFSDFNKRGETLKTDGEETKYLEYIKANAKLKEDYLMAFKGDSLESRLMLKFFPRQYKRKLEKKYTQEHYLRVLLALQSDRTGENVLNMWKVLVSENL